MPQASLLKVDERVRYSRTGMAVDWGEVPRKKGECFNDTIMLESMTLGCQFVSAKRRVVHGFLRPPAPRACFRAECLGVGSLSLCPSRRGSPRPLGAGPDHPDPEQTDQITPRRKYGPRKTAELRAWSTEAAHNRTRNVRRNSWTQKLDCSPNLL